MSHDRMPLLSHSLTCPCTIVRMLFLLHLYQLKAKWLQEQLRFLASTRLTFPPFCCEQSHPSARLTCATETNHSLPLQSSFNLSVIGLDLGCCTCVFYCILHLQELVIINVTSEKSEFM